MHQISTACFIYRSIFAVQALCKRRVHVHCAAYHFRILIKILGTSAAIKNRYGAIGSPCLQPLSIGKGADRCPHCCILVVIPSLNNFIHLIR